MVDMRVTSISEWFRIKCEVRVAPGPVEVQEAGYMFPEQLVSLEMVISPS